MKKYISVLLSAVLVLSVLVFSSCKNGDDATSTDGNAASSSDSTVTETEIVTDENGETVTDENGAAVTTVITVENDASAKSGDDTAVSSSGTAASVEKETKNDSAKSNDYLTLTADSLTAKPGSKVKIYLNAPSCKLFADADIEFFLDGNGTITKALASSDTEDIDYFEFIQNIKSGTDAQVAFYTATTADISNISVCYIEVTVDSNASAGDKINITSNVNLFEVGTDASGAETQKVSANCPSITITVAK